MAMLAATTGTTGDTGGMEIADQPGLCPPRNLGATPACDVNGFGVEAG
jgi:hypothetical protein